MKYHRDLNHISYMMDEQKKNLESKQKKDKYKDKEKEKEKEKGK
jgi:hypothetical protein